MYTSSHTRTRGLELFLFALRQRVAPSSSARDLSLGHRPPCPSLPRGQSARRRSARQFVSISTLACTRQCALDIIMRRLALAAAFLSDGEHCGVEVGLQPRRREELLDQRARHKIERPLANGKGPKTVEEPFMRRALQRDGRSCWKLSGVCRPSSKENCSKAPQ